MIDLLVILTHSIPVHLGVLIHRSVTNGTLPSSLHLLEEHGVGPLLRRSVVRSRLVHGFQFLLHRKGIERSVCRRPSWWRRSTGGVRCSMRRLGKRPTAHTTSLGADLHVRGV